MVLKEKSGGAPFVLRLHIADLDFLGSVIQRLSFAPLAHHLKGNQHQRWISINNVSAFVMYLECFDLTFDIYLPEKNAAVVDQA